MEGEGGAPGEGRKKEKKAAEEKINKQKRKETLEKKKFTKQNEKKGWFHSTFR